jgi:hypothetical protein
LGMRQGCTLHAALLSGAQLRTAASCRFRPSHTKAHSWHTRSEFDKFLAQFRRAHLANLPWSVTRSRSRLSVRLRPLCSRSRPSASGKPEAPKTAATCPAPPNPSSRFASLVLLARVIGRIHVGNSEWALHVYLNRRASRRVRVVMHVRHRNAIPASRQCYRVRLVDNIAHA